MTEKNIDIGEESILEEEWESYLRHKEQRKKLKAIMFCALPLIIVFLVCAYYFISMVEEAGIL